MRFFLAYQDSPSRTRPFSSSFSSSLQILNTSHSRCRSLPRSRCSKSSFKSRVPVSASVFVSSVSPSSSCLRRSSFLPPLERRKHMGNLSSHPSFFHASSSPIQRHLSHTLAIRSFRIQTSPLSCSLSSSSSSPKSLLTSPSSDVSSSLSSFSSSLSSLFSLTSFLHYHLFSSSLTTSPLSSSPPVFRHNPLSSLNPSFSFSFSSSSSSPSHSPSSSSSSLSPSPRVRSIEAFLLREGYEAFRLDQILLHMYGSRGGSQGRATPGKKNFRFPVRRLSGMTTLSKHLLQDLHRLIHTQLYPTPSSLSSSSLRSCRDSDLSKEKSKNDVVTQPHKRRRRREEEEETEGRSEEEEAAEYMENLGERKIFSPPAMERQMRREDTSPKEKLATEEERRRRRTRDKGKALEDSYERAEEEEEKEDERNTSHTSLSLDSSSSSSSSAFSPSSSFSTSFSRKLDELRGEERFEKNSSSFLQVPKDDFLSVYPLEEKDGKRSRKILFTCKKDSARVEAVSLRFSSHHSLCISTQ
ncbi:radical sam domain-containing protein, partial [Cystoisospora suis]